MSRPVLVATLLATLGCWPAGAARIVLVNVDGPNVGFNDPTRVAGVTGNSARTLGEQRRRVFEAVAFRLGSLIASEAEIRVEGGWDSLDCETSSGTLAQGGPTFVYRDFPGSPKASTWYASALANALAGEDLNPGEPAMSFTFNSDVGTAGCLSSRQWDYRIGVSGTNGFSMEDVLFHEMGHGINFTSFVDGETGEKFMGLNDAYMIHLEDHSNGKRWSSMSNAQRAASATRPGLLHWLGGNALAHAVRLRGGTHAGSGHPRMYSPDPLEEGSSVAHWDTVFDNNVDDFMEPFARANTADLLTGHLFQDLGWSVNRMAADWVEDQNGNGSPEVALLQVRDDPAGHEIVLMDTRGGVVLRIPLPADRAPLDLAVVDHFDGSPASEIAVLLWRPQGANVEIRLFDAASGEEVGRFGLPSGFPMRMLRVPDYGGTAADELAVLGIRATSGARVWVRDAQSGANVKNFSFPRAERPVDLAVLDSYGGTSAPELATLIAVPKRGRAEIKVRDGRSKALLGKVVLPDDQVAQFLGGMADFGGVAGSAELAVASLGSDTGTPRLTVFDGSSGAELSRREFDRDFAPVAFEVLPNFGGSLADELVLWTQLPGNLKPRGYVVDGGTMANLGGPSLDARWEPKALAVLPNIGKTGALDTVLVASSSRDRKLRAFLIDGRGGKIRSLTLP